jgi:hypothetical protein
MRVGSVVIGAMTTATKNVIQGPGGPSDSGANRGASADVRMRASADAGTRCSANRRASQSSTAADCQRQQAEAANRRSYTFEKICHGPPPEKQVDRKTCSRIVATLLAILWSPKKYIESCEVALIIETKRSGKTYPFNKSQSGSAAGFHWQIIKEFLTSISAGLIAY